MTQVHPGEKGGVGDDVKIFVYFLLSPSDLMRKLSLLPKSSLFTCNGNW